MNLYLSRAFLSLIFFPSLSFSLQGIHANLFIILLKSCHVLPGLRELSLFHTLSDIPVNKSSLGVHQVKLVIKPSPCLSNSSCVGQHADSSLHLGQISSRNHSGWLVVDTDLEPSRAPINELNGSLGLNSGNGSVDILGDDITSVEHAAGHVLAMAGVALDHLVRWLEACVGDLGYRQLLVIGLLSRDDWGVGDQGEVDSGVRDQVGLELGQVDVESSIESQRGSDRGDDLADQTVEVGVGWSVNVEIAAADVVDSLIIDHEGAVRVLQRGVGCQDGVVRLDHSSGHLGSWVD